jgi:glutamate carboxypeptidase
MDYTNYFKSRRGEMLALLKKIVSLESPTADRDAVNACAACVAGEFKRAGARVTRYPQADIGDLHLFEYAPGALKKEPERILVLVHLDTVWSVGKIGSMPYYISGEKVFGPGVLDMKAGVVMAIFALQALSQLNIVPGKRIAVFANSAEETGHEAGHALIRDLARKSSLVLCLEPALPGGALKTERKGRIVVKLVARGKAAHAGTPSNGVNAIEELIAHLVTLKKIRTGETTVNIGQISGGERPNIVPESASATLDIRFWRSTDRDRVQAFFRGMEPALKGAKIKAVFESPTPPMEKSRASVELLARAREIAAGIGISLSEGKTGGGSDASIASSLGLPTLDGLGPDGNGIHAEHEHLLIPSLVERTALLTELLVRL